MILVTGGSGQLARRVLELLLEQAAGPLITTTRSPERLADLAARGVVVRQADFSQPAEDIVPAFRGAQKMLLVSTNTLEGWGKRFEQHQRAIRAAVDAGVRHIVYTSLTFPYPASPVALAKDHLDTENFLRETGLDYTILRNNIYAESLLFSLPVGARTGRLRAAAGDGRAAYVTREDCAKAAAGALLRGETRCIYEISGPAALGFAELARMAGALSGREIVYEPVGAEERKQELIDGAMDPTLAELWVSFERAIAAGMMDLVTRDVELLSGSAPESVEDFLRRNWTMASAQ
ncbi:MAG: SDR family oxidoreductase [Bryobacteraceae bacterium]